MVVWMLHHFAVLAVDYEANPLRPVLLDTLSHTPYLNGTILKHQGPRVNDMARLMLALECGDDVEVDLAYHVQQQPHAKGPDEIQSLCGLYACALMYDVMIEGKIAREVSDTKNDPFLFAPVDAHRDP